jgi:hypothetical protein
VLELGARTVSYDGRLFIRTLLPEPRTVSIIGGPGFEYYNAFNQTNYPPSAAATAGAPREAGAWRMEVSPVAHNSDDLFLNAFQIADASTRGPVESRLLTDEGKKTTGVLFLSPANRVVLFSTALGATPASLPLSYETDSPAEAHHLLLGLPPGLAVTIEVNHRMQPRRAVSTQGTLNFEDKARGRREVHIERAPVP